MLYTRVNQRTRLGKSSTHFNGVTTVARRWPMLQCVVCGASLAGEAMSAGPNECVPGCGSIADRRGGNSVAHRLSRRLGIAWNDDLETSPGWPFHKAVLANELPSKAALSSSSPKPVLLERPLFSAMRDNRLLSATVPGARVGHPKWCWWPCWAGLERRGRQRGGRGTLSSLTLQVKSDLCGGLGHVYMDLDNLEQAEEQIRTSLTIAEQVLPVDMHRIWQARAALGRILEEQER